MFSCDLCGEKFRKESKFRYHIETVWCDECQLEWKCKYHIETSWCNECDLKWKCQNEADIHTDQEHKLKCNICEHKFVKESTLKYHNQVWYCDACDSTYECEYRFIDHIEDLDHYLVKNLRPN